MTDMYQNVSDQMDPLTRLVSMVPGFSGYVKRENRRAADKLMREAIANRFEEQWKRISNLQADLVAAGKIEYVDDLEKAGIQASNIHGQDQNGAPGLCGRVRRCEDQ